MIRAHSSLTFLHFERTHLQWERTIKRLHGATQQENLGHLLQNDIPSHEFREDLRALHHHTWRQL